MKVSLLHVFTRRMRVKTVGIVGDRLSSPRAVCGFCRDLKLRRWCMINRGEETKNAL